MALIDRLRALIRRDNRGNATPVVYSNPWGPDWRERLKDMSIPALFATQPDLQAVIAFRAREMASLPLHVYRITDAGGYHEKLDGPLRELFVKPNAHQTGYELIRDLVATLDLYGRAYWYVFPAAASVSGWEIEPIHPSWIVGTRGGTVYEPETYIVKPATAAAERREQNLPGANVVRFSAYAPDAIVPVSPIASLKNILAEQIAAWEFRREVWQRGGRVGAYVYRPASPNGMPWEDKARDRFTRRWHEFQRGGARAGETPVLEDGMELRRVGYSPREEEWAEAAKLSLRTVCRVYHVAPGMLGDDATRSYASAREETRQLYTSTLGPIIREIEQRISKFVLPIIDPNAEADGLAVKFNIDAKLAGSFEEQAAVLSTSTGAPWLLVNEARAFQNLRPVEGGDELVVPLNVTAGGQASPQDGGSPSVAVENARRAEAADEEEASS